MDQQQILERINDMVADPDEAQLSYAEMSGLLIHVIKESHDELPERMVNALFIVAASLMRTHVEAVEADILAFRAIMRR